jgi:RNA polymerase sigma factor (sigma-70 family)
VKKHEEEEFEASFRDLFTRAFLLANRILGDPAGAEDVAAEALARTYAEWPKIRDLGYRDAWVLRVTTNLAVDVTRRRRPLPDPGRTVDVQETATLRVALSAALRALPRRQREAVSLRYLAGFTEAEVAAALEVSAGAVRTHIHRGIRALRERLGDAQLEEADIDLA